MLDELDREIEDAETAHHERGRTELVRSESLSFFDEVACALGGDPPTLLRAAHLDPAVVGRPNIFIPYRQFIFLLEHAATVLACPDFGLRLARRQYVDGILGPLDVAMRNLPTVGEAFRFCADHVHAYCPGADIRIEKLSGQGRWAMHFNILLSRARQQRQAVEHALLVSHLATILLSEGKAAAREVWFAHGPLQSTAAYREYFGASVHFAQPYNAIFFNSVDLAAPVIGHNPQLFELASFFLDSQFPTPHVLISAKVRSVICRQLASGRCTRVEIASELGMHPRTMQRRLSGEGQSFETIKDNVRREAAVRYLRHTRLPLKTVAIKLGYSEMSVLYRSCHRWFNRSPGDVRRERGKLDA